MTYNVHLTAAFVDFLSFVLCMFYVYFCIAAYITFVFNMPCFVLFYQPSIMGGFWICLSQKPCFSE